jgi:hypothetical protein
MPGKGQLHADEQEKDGNSEGNVVDVHGFYLLMDSRLSGGNYMQKYSRKVKFKFPLQKNTIAEKKAHDVGLTRFVSLSTQRSLLPEGWRLHDGPSKRF